METKRKILHYRRAQLFTPIPNKNFQALIEEALTKLNSVGQRFNKINEEVSTEIEETEFRRFINTHRSAMGMEFGSLVLYAGGVNRQTLTIDDNLDEVDVEQIAPPPTTDGKRREFLESILYYGIKDNHVVLLQSMALKSRDFENYVNWLLKTARIIAKENNAFLNNYAPKVTKEKLEQATVKSVKIGTPLYSTVGEVVDRGATDNVKKRFKPIGEGLDILKLIAPHRFDDILLDEFQEDSNLEVFVEITYKRQTDNPSQELLNKLTQALRHVSDDDIKIELRNAGTIVGSELQIKSFKNIETHNGLVQPKNVFEKMHEWLSDNLEMGLIDPD